MPLFIIRAFPGEACGYGPQNSLEDLQTEEIHVYAKNEVRARQLAVQHLMEEEQFREIQVFASPRLSTCDRVTTRQPEGVRDTYYHHCVDHA